MSGGIDDGMTWGEGVKAETDTGRARRLLEMLAGSRSAGIDPLTFQLAWAARLILADHAAQAQRIAELEARPLIPAGAKVEIHTPPMPESELISYLQRQNLDMHKEINRLRGFAAMHNTTEAHNG